MRYAANYRVVVEFGADGYSGASAVRDVIEAALAHIPNVDHVGCALDEDEED